MSFLKLLARILPQETPSPKSSNEIVLEKIKYVCSRAAPSYILEGAMGGGVLEPANLKKSKNFKHVRDLGFSLC